MGELKLILTTKDPNLLGLANYTSYPYIMIILNRLVLLKLKIFFYFYKNTITTLTIS